MIRPLRQRHRHVILALAIVLPPLLAVAILARKPFPVVEGYAGGPLVSPAFERVEWPGAGLFGDLPVDAQLLRETQLPGRYALSFSAAKGFVKPDLLVYWVPGTPSADRGSLSNAVLLGGFGADALRLPAETATEDGVLALYSLADHQLVGLSQPLRLRPSSR